jgi:RNA polymerase sigma factor (sigma-70 family)
MEAEVTRSLDLLAKAQKGDRAALDRLITRYYDRVRRIVRARMGTKLRTTLESGDILQDVFMKACQIYDRFDVDHEANLIAWLATIAERQITDAADKAKAAKRSAARIVPLETMAADASGNMKLDPQEPSLPPLALVEQVEQGAIVEDCLRELKPEHRELILHRDYMGASWDVVAKETGRPSAAAARMMHAQALVELGKLVGKRTHGNA